LGIGVQHFFVEALGVVAIAESGVSERQVGMGFGPCGPIFQTAFEGFGGTAEILALEAEVAHAEARFLFFRRALQYLVVVALGLLELSRVLQQQRQIPKRRKSVGVGLHGTFVGGARGGEVAQLLAYDTEIGVALAGLRAQLQRLFIRLGRRFV